MAAASPAHSGASAADVSTPSAAGSDEFAAYGYAIGPADPVPEALGARFKDFDKEDVYNDVVAHANIEGALNFVVQFGDDEAQVACDLSDVEIERLLAQPAELRDMRMPIRWMYAPPDTSFLVSRFLPLTDHPETSGTRAHSAALSRPSAAATASPSASP